MRKTGCRRSLTTALILGLFGMSAVATAADPLIGTWSLNHSKSKFSTLLGPPPKQQTETYREIEGGQIEFSSKQTWADGSSVSSKYIWPAPEGGAVKVEQQFPGIEPLTYVEVRLAPGEWLVITMRDGRQMAHRRKVISKDGRTRRDTLTIFPRTGNNGKPIEQVEVYDRQ